MRVALVVLPVSAFLISLFLGRYPLSPASVLSTLLLEVMPNPGGAPSTADVVVLQIRLPRVLLGLAIGGGLSISGAAFQGMFRNPLVSSEVLGVSAGAGFGAALMILLSGDPIAVQAGAFVCGIVAVAMAYGLSRINGTTGTLMLVLAGIVVGAVFSALVSLITYTADPYQKLPAIVFWLMGSLSKASSRQVVGAAPPMLIGAGVLLLLRWRLNVLSMGDQDARALGINVELVKSAVVVFATLVTAAAVSVSGVIGWVGLIVPHIARMVVGPDHRLLLPATLSLGATYLVVVDDIARVATSAEIPLGILTGMVGAPFLLYLIHRTRVAWN